MPGVIYMVLCLLVGKELAEYFLFYWPAEKERKSKGNFCWIFWPAAFGTGTLAVTWLTYAASWIAEALLDTDRPLLFGNIAVMLLAACVLGCIYWRRVHKGICPLGKRLFRTGETEKKEGLFISDRESFQRETLFFTILTVFVTWMMF